MRIRNATLSDLDNILYVEQSAFPPERQGDSETFQKRYALFKEGFFVIEVDNRIVGFSTALLTDDITSIDDLNISDSELHNPHGVVYELRSVAVKKESQNKGLGQKLVVKQIDNAKKFGKRFIRFTAAHDVEKFYDKLGFRRITPYQLFHNSEQALWEKKIITSA